MGFGVVSSDLTLSSGLCLKKDEILLWVFSGFLDIEGPKDSNECKKLMGFLPASPWCSGLRVTNRARVGVFKWALTWFQVLMGKLRRHSFTLIPGTWELQVLACGRQAH